MTRLKFRSMNQSDARPIQLCSCLKVSQEFIRATDEEDPDSTSSENHDVRDCRDAEVCLIAGVANIAQS